MKRTAVLTALAVFSLTSCGKKDIDKVSEAQSCLDSATSTTALACLSKVDGLDSAAANVVRCSAYFVDQGFSDPTRLAQVAQQITDTSNPDGGSMGALSAMAFTASKYTMTENDTLSGTASTACQASSVGGLIYLSTMSRIATAMLKDLGTYDPSSGTAPTPTQVQDAMCPPATPSSATKIAAGNSAIAAYNKNCVGKDISTDIMCLQYKAALDQSSDPATVGQLLITSMCP